MIKDEIVSVISRETCINKNLVKTVVDSMLYNITKALSNGEEVKFAGFGTFELKERAPRIGRNPHTGEKILIPARVIPSFKAGSSLKNTISNNKEDFKNGAENYY